MPPFLPETFTFINLTPLQDSPDYSFLPKTFTFFKSNVMTTFKGFTSTLLVFLKSFSSDILYPEFFFFRIHPVLLASWFPRTPNRETPSTCHLHTARYSKKIVVSQNRIFGGYTFSKRKRQNIGNKTFLQKKYEVFLLDNDKGLSQLSFFLFIKCYKCNFSVKMKIINLASSTF